LFPVRGRLVLNKIPVKLLKEDSAALFLKLKEASFGSGRMLYLSSYNENVLPLEHRHFPEDSFLDPGEAVVLVLIEDELPTPRKSFFHEENDLTPRRKYATRTSKELEYGIDYVNSSVPNSPRGSVQS